MVNAPLQLTGHIPIELSEDGGFGLLWREILGNTDTYMDEDATILEGHCGCPRARRCQPSQHFRCVPAKVLDQSQ